MTNFNDKILEARANKFRDKVGVGNSDPIDLYKVLSELNVLTNFRPMSPDFSGMALKIENNRFILVNNKQTRARQHFTIGHELYHLFIQTEFSFMLCKTGRFDKKDKEEYNADIFSSFLLMPESGMLKTIPEQELARGGKITLQTIIRLEQYFGVSRKALLVRLAKMEVLNYEEYAALYSTGIKRSANELGYSTKLYEKGSDYNIIGNYGLLCKNLYEHEQISESHYFNLMHDIGINIDEKFEENDNEW